MLTIISGLLLLALIAVPGYLACRFFFNDQRASMPLYELGAVSLAAGVLLIGWLALLLVEVGVLHLPILTILVGLCAAGLALVMRRQRRRLAVPMPPWRLSDSAFVAVAAIVLVLAARPHETILGGTDAGVYANTGANIARTGRLLIDDYLTVSLASTAISQRAQTDTPDVMPAGVDGAIRHLMLRLPEGRFPFADYLRLAGFYVLDLARGTLTPQFLHLYPTWLGLFGRALGMDGLLFATPVLAWLGAIMAALVGRRLFGPWVGVVTLLILGSNGLQIWFSRHSLSEALLQFLLCTAAYGWVVAHDQPVNPAHRGQPSAYPLAGPLALAGAAVGSLSLAHAQFTFAYALLPPLAVWLWLAGRWRTAYWAFFGPILALSLHGGLHILIFALGYFEGLYHHVILDAWQSRARLGGLLVLGILSLAFLRWQRHIWWPRVTQPAMRRLAPVVAASAVGVVLAYTYFVRPGIITAANLNVSALAGYIGAPVPLGPEANLVRLGWYLSPLGMVLAGIGAVAIVRRFDVRMIMLVGLAWVYGLAFNLASFTHESYIYSLRRFVPIVLPFACIAAAYAIVVVIPALVARHAPSYRPSVGRVIGATSLALLMLFFVVTGRTLASHVENDGVRAQVAAIAGKFQANDILVFAGQRDEPHKLATPLRFFHGIDAIVVSTNNPRGDLIDTWIGEQINQGRRVRLALGNNGGKLLLPNYRLEPVGTIDVTMRELERLAAQKPFNIQTNRLEYTIYDLHPAVGAPFAGPPYRYQTGPGDEQAGVLGWYGRESDEHGTNFRWSNGDAMLRIPWPVSRGQMTLKLELSAGARPTNLGPARVEIFLATTQNDRTAPLIGTLTLTPEFSTYEIQVPSTAIADQPNGAAILWLRNTAWQPSERDLVGDARPLGLRLAGLELSYDRR